MPEENGLTHEQAAFESALSALAPAAGLISRDRLMFQAGRRAAGSSGWLWRCATLLLALGLGLSLMPRTGRPIRGNALLQPTAGTLQLAQGPTTQPPRPDQRYRPTGAEYLHLRQLVLQRGVAALPVPSETSSDGPWTRGRPLARLLNEHAWGTDDSKGETP
jgi:hypothetical protein